jgi:hypothetical protein
MSQPDPLSQWIETVSTMLPQLSRPQAKVLAYWSYGMVIAKSCGITLVCAALALQLDCSEASLVQRFREWCYGAKDKKGEHLFWAEALVDPGLVAGRSTATGPGLGCNDVEATLYGAGDQRRVSGLRHSRGVESGGRSRKGSLGAPLAQAA